MEDAEEGGFAYRPPPPHLTEPGILQRVTPPPCYLFTVSQINIDFELTSHSLSRAFGLDLCCCRNTVI